MTLRGSRTLLSLGAVLAFASTGWATETLLFEELFEDTGWASRGWYDPYWHYYHDDETRAAIDLIESRDVDLSRMHTHSFPLSRAEAAIRTLAGEFEDERAIHCCLLPALE